MTIRVWPFSYIISACVGSRSALNLLYDSTEYTTIVQTNSDGNEKSWIIKRWDGPLWSPAVPQKDGHPKVKKQEIKVTAVGFEPTANRLKGDCSTPELRGHASSNRSHHSPAA